MIIDPPSPFAPLETWREFLAGLEALPEQRSPDAEIVQRYKELARSEIRQLDPRANFA